MPTDYYRPIANAIARLNPNTVSARRSIYDQARKLLFEEAQGSNPPMGVSELIREQRALEQAIHRVEAENLEFEAVEPEDEVQFRPPPRTRAPVRAQPPVPVTRRGPPVRQAPVYDEPAYQEPEYEEPPLDPEYYDEEEDAPPPRDQRERHTAARTGPMRAQEQRRLEVEERRAQRQGRSPSRARAVRGTPSSMVVVVAAVLFALFLVGAAAAYVMVFGWPKYRGTPQQQTTQQQKKKEETPPPANDNAVKAKALLDQASRALEGGNPAGAVQLLTEAIVLSPKDAQAYTLRGHSYLQSGDPNKAIEDFSEAINLGSRDFYAFVGRAVAYRRIRDFPRSIADYNEAIKIKPDHAGAWNNRCFVQAITGDLEKALADCNESLRLMPNEPNALDSRALVYLKQGKWDLAIADYDAVLKAQPNTVSALYGRGYAKLKKGDKRGQADMSTATTAAPTIAQEFERYGLK